MNTEGFDMIRMYHDGSTVWRDMSWMEYAFCKSGGYPEDAESLITSRSMGEFYLARADAANTASEV
jgi:hypothetical protein